MITILTPTYNREYILHEAYESLLAQTDKDFEWVVIDDGSTDGTQEKVLAWQKESPFPIVYERKENGGKHRALNVGSRLAKAEYTLILDSDDSLTENAVATVKGWIEEIKDLDGFAGVAGLKGYKGRNQAVGGTCGDKKFIDATNLERKKYKLMGDKAEVYKTELLRKYPFPEFEGEKFIREGAVWDRIAKDGYKIRWYNEIIYECDYLEDGLTKNLDKAFFAKNIQGYAYCTKLYLETHGWLASLLQIGRYASIAKINGATKEEICKTLGINKGKLTLGKALYGIWAKVKKGV